MSWKLFFQSLILLALLIIGIGYGYKKYLFPHDYFCSEIAIKDDPALSKSVLLIDKNTGETWITGTDIPGGVIRWFYVSFKGWDQDKITLNPDKAKESIPGFLN